MRLAEVRYRKGDRVRFQLGFRPVEGTVKEDRGPIGIKGRHLYLIEFHREMEPVREIELPAVEMELVQTAARRD